MLLPLLLTSAVFAQDAPRALHLGNSYTFYNDLPLRVSDALRASVPAMATAEGARLAAGGLRLPNHVERVDAGDAQWVDALTGEPGRWTWMVLQDQSQVPGFPESESIWQDSANAVTQLDGYAVGQGAETVLFMTWGRRDGDSTNPTMFPDFETMNALLDEGYRAFATRGSEPDRTLWIAPVGRAFGAVYTRVAAEGSTPEDAGTDFYRLYDGDGSHPSPLGTALSAAVFVRTFTGWSAQWDSPPTGVDAADLPWLSDAADAAVEPFVDLPYPWAQRVSVYSPPADVSADLGWVVSGTDLCQTVGIDTAMDAESQVTVGAMHAGVAGCGRVWMLEGGEWSVDALAIEAGVAEAGGSGSVVVAGGALDVDTLAVPASVAGGTLTIGTQASAAVQLVDGTVRFAGSSGTDLHQSGGQVVLPVGSADTPHLSLSGAAVLDGALALEGFADAPVAVLYAVQITLGEAVSHDLPSGWVLEVAPMEGGDLLVVVEDDGGGSTGGDDDGGGATGAGTEGETTGSDGESDDASAASGSTGGAEKGGCMATGGLAGGLFIAMGGAMVRRRRGGVESAVQRRRHG